MTEQDTSPQEVPSFRICMLLYHYWPNAVGGAEQQCRKLSKELSSQNVSCTILTVRHSWRQSAKEMDDRVMIRRFYCTEICVKPLVAVVQRFKKYRNISPAPLNPTVQVHKRTNSKSGNISRWINCFVFMVGITFYLLRHRKKIDVLHVHIADWLAGFAGWIAPKLSLPVLVKAANSPPLHPIHPATPLRKLVEQGRENVHYIALHEGMKGEIEGSGIRAKSITVIPNGVDLVMPTSGFENRSSVLYVGNFSQGTQHKGFDILLEAWVLVVQECPSAQLVLVGKGDETFWKAESKRLGVSQSVRFAGYQPDLDSFYRDAGLLVLPSRHEGMSNALLEAQSYGVPAVVSDIPANQAVIDNGVSGYIVPVGYTEGFSEKIVGMLKDPAIREEMATNARINIQNRFSMQKIAERYKKVYAEIS